MQIALIGMSCVGKTTFAQKMPLKLISFDSFYRYDLAVLPNFNHIKNLELILDQCEDDFVIDNWLYYDCGKTFYTKFPEGCIYLLYSSYNDILARYRNIIHGPDAFLTMYENMYINNDFSQYKNIKYFYVGANNKETSCEEYKKFILEDPKKCEKSFNSTNWIWQ